MKLRLLLCVFLSLCLCSACRHKPLPADLTAIDSLTNTNPDSALVLLRAWPDSLRTPATEAERMYHALLTVKANDKAYMPHTTDTTILRLLAYYRKQGDPRLLPEAYYLAGRVYSDLGDAPQALEYFYKAKECSKPNDYNLLSRINNQIGTLYIYQDIYDKALLAFEEGHKCNLIAQDSTNLIFSLRDLGRTYMMLEKDDSATYYYLEADKLATRTNNMELKIVVDGEIASFFITKELYQEAYAYIQTALQVEQTEDCGPCYSVAGTYFYNIGKYDSAAYYYRQAIQYGNYYQKQAAYKGLGTIARIKGDKQKALEYFDIFLAYTDSISQITQTESVQKTTALYNYQLHKSKSQRLSKENAKQKAYLAFTVTTLIVITALSFAYFQLKKRKTEEKINQLQKLKQLEEYRYKQSQDQIAENKTLIKKLEQELEKSHVEQDQLQQDLFNARKRALEKTNEQIEAKNLMKEEAIKSLVSSDLFQRLHTPDVKLSQTDWTHMREAIDNAYDHFTQRLLFLYPMTDIELQVCLLLKMGIPINKIPSLVMRSKQAITSIRRRLYKKVFKEDGTPNQWDEFVKGF